jgi:hypothetical protein
MIKTSTVLLIFYCFFAWPDETCRSVNLLPKKKWGRIALDKERWDKIPLDKKKDREKPWFKLYRQMPAYQQKSSPICYAYASIQLVDFWRQTQGIKITEELMLTDPIYVAYLTRQYSLIKDYSKSTNLSGGTLSHAIHSIKELGLCRGDVLKNIIKELALNKNVDITLDNLNIYLEKVFLKYPKFKQKVFKLNILKPLATTYNLDVAKIKSMLTPHLENGNIITFMNELFAPCKHPKSIIVSSRYIPNPYTYEANTSEKRDNLKMVLRGLLNKKMAQPAGLSFCYNVLMQKTYRGLTFQDNELVKRPDCDYHSVLLVGKKMINNKCHYLLKNTWSEDAKYDWEVKRDLNNKTQGIWVDEEAITENIHTLVWLPTKEPDHLCMVNHENGKKFIEVEVPSINGINYLTHIFKDYYINVSGNLKKELKIYSFKPGDKTYLPASKDSFISNLKKIKRYNSNLKVKDKFKISCLPVNKKDESYYTIAKKALNESAKNYRCLASHSGNLSAFIIDNEDIIKGKVSSHNISNNRKLFFTKDKNNINIFLGEKSENSFKIKTMKFFNFLSFNIIESFFKDPKLGIDLKLICKKELDNHKHQDLLLLEEIKKYMTQR